MTSPKAQHGSTSNRKPETSDENEFAFSEETAATRIQANFRGFKARKELTEKMKGQEASNVNTSSHGGQSQAPDEELDIDLTDPDLSKAATKIQASFRGHKVRKDVKPVAEETLKHASATSKTKVEEELDVDLTDPELEKAATKIQATFRGYQSKKK